MDLEKEEQENRGSAEIQDEESELEMESSLPHKFNLQQKETNQENFALVLITEVTNEEKVETAKIEDAEISSVTYG